MEATHDSAALRKGRGAFFTPPAIANFLADWAVGRNSEAKVLEPTCGEAVFLLAAGRKLVAEGCPPDRLDQQLYGADLHQRSLDQAMALLEAEGLDAHLLPPGDFFEVPTPDQMGCPLPPVDAVIGNPPFIRYQQHTGRARQLSVMAAMRQGVRLNGMASSWAATVVHASGFLKPDGRLAIVLPAELLSVQYAEPVRRWLKARFASVHLVVFERLQFQDALEKVVLLVAKGTGGCDSFSLHYVHDAEDLVSLHAFDNVSVTPAAEGKWSDLLLPLEQRQLFKKATEQHFEPLGAYGLPELGTVTGGNAFFTLSESTRREYGLEPDRHVVKVSPPGTKHLRGLAFKAKDWTTLKDAGERVWLLRPADPDDAARAIKRYTEHGRELGIHEAYKCSIRKPWYCPPVTPTPDLFFTYMSHRYPRLITNTAGVAFVNSMHGIRLRPEAPQEAKVALPLLMLNSATMLGAEVYGRSYGGGVLKMEPREAGRLPVPCFTALETAWANLKGDRDSLDRQLRRGVWVEVSKRVDEALLKDAMGLEVSEVEALHEAARSLRAHRLGTPS
jgi:tRNA1(Val) A37 N6-methylase TrmN6